MSDYYQPQDVAWYEAQMKALKQSHLPINVPTQTFLKAVEDEDCRNSWKHLGSLPREDRQNQMADYEKSFEVWDDYWKSSSVDHKFDIWKDR